MPGHMTVRVGRSMQCLQITVLRSVLQTMQKVGLDFHVQTRLATLLRHIQSLRDVQSFSAVTSRKSRFQGTYKEHDKYSP